MTLTIAAPVDMGGGITVEYLVLVRLLASGHIATVSRAAASVVTVSNLHFSTKYALSAQAINSGGDSCFDGILFSVNPGDASVAFEVLEGYSAAGVTASFAVQQGSVALRMLTGAYQPVVQLQHPTSAQVSSGMLPLVATYSLAAVDSVPGCLCGVPSSEVVTETQVAELAGSAGAPVLREVTGGLIGLDLVSPIDTGGTAVTSFLVVLQPQNAAMVQEHLQVRA